MTHRMRCANGLEVTLIETTGESVGISLVGTAGALHATPGLAHFLEHTVLCATKQHPDFLSLANTVDSLGLERNASTSQETIRFVFKCLPEHVPSALAFLSEVTTDALLLESDVEKQKKIVAQEISRENNDLPAIARLGALANLYQNTGPGVPILGTKEDVESISTEGLADFYHRAFVAENFRLVVCGRLDASKLLSDAESTLGRMPSAKSESTAPAILPRATTSPSPTRTVTRREGATQAVVTIAWEAPASEDPLCHATQMFKVLMADGRLSRLWQSLRQRNALTYSSSCFYVRQRSFGYLYITTGLATENVDRALDEIRQEIRALAENLINDEDLSRIRNLIRTGLVFDSDSAFTLANYHSTKIMSDSAFISIEGELRKYQAVTKEDIREVARALVGRPEHVSIVTP